MEERNCHTDLPKWFQFSDQIRVSSIDRVSVTNVHPCRTLLEWALVLVTKGERKFRAFDQNHVVHSNEFFLLPANVPHSGVKLDEHQAYFVHFAAEGREVDAPGSIVSDHILLPMYGTIPVDLHCIDLMEYAVQHRTPPFYSRALIEAQVTAVLYQLSIHMQKCALWTKNENAGASEILTFIDNHLDKDTTCQDYSEAFGLSCRQLNNIFSRVYGTTIKQMQQHLRIGRAKIMLGAGYSIANTSVSCGFDDYLYFLKFFKNQTGFTPSEYQIQTSASTNRRQEQKEKR